MHIWVCVCLFLSQHCRLSVPVVCHFHPINNSFTPYIIFYCHFHCSFYSLMRLSLALPWLFFWTRHFHHSLQTFERRLHCVECSQYPNLTTRNEQIINLLKTIFDRIVSMPWNVINSLQNVDGDIAWKSGRFLSNLHQILYLSTSSNGNALSSAMPNALQAPININFFLLFSVRFFFLNHFYL